MRECLCLVFQRTMKVQSLRSFPRSGRDTSVTSLVINPSVQMGLWLVPHSGTFCQRRLLTPRTILSFSQLVLDLFLLSRSINAYDFPFSTNQLFDRFIYSPFPESAEHKAPCPMMEISSWIRPTACSPSMHCLVSRPPYAQVAGTA